VRGHPHALRRGGIDVIIVPMSSGRTKRSAKTMPKGLAILLLAVLGVLFLGAAGLILWYAAPTRVTGEFRADGRADVTVERRFLGWHTFSSETVPDVVSAHTHRVSSKGRSGSGGSKSKYVVMLVSRDGFSKRVSGVESTLEVGVKSLAQQIHDFVQGSSKPPMNLWSVSWLLNSLALPFVLVSFLMFIGLGESLLRTLGILKPAEAPSSS
jgi:hypothetical protein